MAPHPSATVPVVLTGRDWQGTSEPTTSTSTRPSRCGGPQARPLWHVAQGVGQTPASYVNEATFRLNEGNVKIHTLDRLSAFARICVGKRITYKQLTA